MNVREEDLRTRDGLNALFQRALNLGLVKPTEHWANEFLRMAMHCLNADRNPAGLFAKNVSEGNWDVIRQVDEDAARLWRREHPVEVSEIAGLDEPGDVA